MEKRNMKVIYFGDLMGDLEEEKRIIQRKLFNGGIEFTNFTTTDEPPFDQMYDILFFDWGGMSLGNSLLDTFCKEIIDIAEDNPSKYFVMTSTFTSEAMKDALNYLQEDVKLPNIYLSIELFINDYKKL